MTFSNRLSRAAAGLLLALAPTAASAQASANKLPLLGISAQVQREVVNDEMTVMLRVEARHADLATANREALETMNAVLAQLNQVAGVQASLTGVGSNPLYVEKRTGETRERVISGWHAYADAKLRSMDVAVLSGLLGRVAQQARIQSVSFSVSRATRERVSTELQTEAARGFVERAGRLAKALGHSGFEIQQIDISTSGQGPRPPFQPVLHKAMRADAAVMPDLTDAVGESTISANASGTVWLKP